MFSLDDFSILAGSLPPKKQKVAAGWIERNADTLNRMWMETVEGRPVTHFAKDLSE